MICACQAVCVEVNPKLACPDAVPSTLAANSARPFDGGARGSRVRGTPARERGRAAPRRNERARAIGALEPAREGA